MNKNGSNFKKLFEGSSFVNLDNDFYKVKYLSVGKSREKIIKIPSWNLVEGRYRCNSKNFRNILRKKKPIPFDYKYKKYGLLKNPTFYNVQLDSNFNKGFYGILPNKTLKVQNKALYGNVRTLLDVRGGCVLSTKKQLLNLLNDFEKLTETLIIDSWDGSINNLNIDNLKFEIARLNVVKAGISGGLTGLRTFLPKGHRWMIYFPPNGFLRNLCIGNKHYTLYILMFNIKIFHLLRQNSFEEFKHIFNRYNKIFLRKLDFNLNTYNGFFDKFKVHLQNSTLLRDFKLKYSNLIQYYDFIVKPSLNWLHRVFNNIADPSLNVKRLSFFWLKRLDRFYIFILLVAFNLILEDLILYIKKNKNIKIRLNFSDYFKKIEYIVLKNLPSDLLLEIFDPKKYGRTYGKEPLLEVFHNITSIKSLERTKKLISVNLKVLDGLLTKYNLSLDNFWLYIPVNEFIYLVKRPLNIDTSTFNVKMENKENIMLNYKYLLLNIKEVSVVNLSISDNSNNTYINSFFNHSYKFENFFLEFQNNLKKTSEEVRIVNTKSSLMSLVVSRKKLLDKVPGDLLKKQELLGETLNFLTYIR